jgi:hypothetical protein
MNYSKMIEQMKLAKAELEKKIADMELDKSRILQLDNAIKALSGQGEVGFRDTPTNGKTMTDMILESAKRLDSVSPGAEFTVRSLATEAAQLYPTHYAQIKKGVHTAANGLCKKNILNRTENGYQLVIGPQ